MKHSWKRIFALILAVVMTLSLLPTAALAAPRAGGVTIDVTEYGADPTGTKESSTAVIAALAAAKELPEGTQKTIYFPKGEYHFYEDYSETRELYASNTLRWNERSYANKNIGILVEGMKNVTVDGGGSLFIYHGNVCTMAAIDSKNVTFTNFSEDFASPEVVDVTVEAHEGDNAAIIFIPACYNYTISGTNINWQGEISPVTGQPYWSGDNGFLSYRQYLDTVTGRSSSGGKYPFDNVSSITKVDDTHIKVVYSNAGSRPPVGQSCQMRHPNPRKTPGVFFLNSEDITLSNANFHFLHGFGMVGQLCTNITLDKVKCQARPGTGRTSAGFADFVQMSSIAGKVTVRDCEFADPHDDPINIHGTFLEVKEITADRRRVVVRYMHNETWGFPQYNVGDTVDFSVKDTLATTGITRTVTGVVNPGEGLNLNGSARSKDSEEDMRTIIVELDEALPDTITANSYVMENVTHTPEVLIENCRFTETPTRGILVTTRKPVVIRNNYFDRICSSSIFISCDGQDWRESGHSEDVLITGNTFIAENITGLGDHYGGTGVIMIWPTNPNDDPNYQIHRNIRIEDNVFSLLPMGGAKRTIVAKSVNGLTVKNNLFQRYTPNMELALAAGSTALTAGGTQSTTLTSSGNTLTNQLFRLQACKNITFEGNTYDDGLNLGVQLDGNVVTAADVTDNDGVLTVGGNNQLPAVGQARYFSSDPTVATVDESGVVTGVSAGTAEIYAYRVAGARTFESNHLTFTVTGEAAAKPNKIEISGDSTVDVDGNVTLTATVDPVDAGSVAWSVKPAADGGAATITSGGVLTATAPGVVEVTASLGGVTASKLVTVNKPNFEYLSDLSWTGTPTMGNGGSAPKLDKAWSNVAIMLKSSANGTETFAKGLGVHAPAEITYDLAGKGYTRFTAKVGVSQDVDGVVKPGEAKLKFTVLGDGSELASSSGTQMMKSDAYQEIDVDISSVNTLVIKTTDPTGNNWSAHGNWADAKLYTNNQAPTVSGVAVTSANPLTVSYSYADTDNDAQTNSIIAWYVSDSETGHYTRIEGANTDTLTVTAATGGKWVKAVVVPKDATGRYGAPVTSAAVQAPAQPVVQDDATLATLSVSGLPLTPAFDPAVTAYTVSAPASATKVTIAATATQATAGVLGTGAVTISGAETTATVTVTAPDGTTTKTYTVTIDRAASSDATLSNLTASAGSGASITYNADTRFYELVAAQTAQSLTFSATKADPNATIAVRYNSEEKGAYEDAPKTLPLTAGFNNLELRVTAEDGISTALYRVRVMKPASTEAELTALTVNGGAVTIPADSADLGLVPVTGNTATLNATVSDGATVYLSVDGKAVENGVSTTLTKTLSMVTIRVVAEDGVTENVYTMALSKPDPDNAQLYSLKLGNLALSPAFDPEVTEYTATDYGFAKAALTAVAAQGEATVTYETLADYKTDTGRITGDCRFFKDEGLQNKVTVTVTSPNGKNTKTYTVTVDVVESAYLSDLPWTSATSGWREVRRDYDVDPNTNDRLSLLEGGQTVTYNKGLGTHANSEIKYDLSAMGFTTFTAKVGMDHSQASANTTQRLRFYVDVDGTNEYTSGELGSTMNCEAVSVNVTNKKQLTLRVIYTTGGDANAHADWADAKLSGNIPLLSQTTDVPVKYIEFEHEEHTIYVNGTDDAHPSSVELHPTFKPVGVTASAHTLALDWDSTDDTVATVTDGVVTPFSVGETTITATAVDKNATDTCTITVKKLVEGTLSVSGDLRYGTQLTVRDNDLDQDVRGNVTYTWYRGSQASGTPLATGKTYTPVKDDIDQVLTVKAAAKDTATYYEGETTFTTEEIGREAGHEVNEDNITFTNCSGEAAEDGTIQGLLEGHVYQYQKQNDDETWPEAWEDVAEGNLTITGLAPGNYRIRHAGDETCEPGEPSNTITISVVGTTEVALTVPQRFTGGVVRANRSQIPVGDTVTLTVTPDKGYELDTLEAKYTDENDVEQTLTPAKGSDGKYTFVMPAFPVTIDATFTKSTYTISHGLEHISCNEEEHQHTATHGETFSIILTPEEGYNMPRSLTVTETDTGKKFTDFTYDASETDPVKRVLTFPNGVTCHITVEGAGVPKTYTVVYELTNGLTAPGAPQTATHSKTLSATLTAARGYTLPQEIAVTVAGAELTVDEDYTYDAETGVVTIESVTGNVVITAQGEAEDVPLRTVTLVGPARVGRTLTVNVEPTLATVECQWFLVDEDGTETEIAGATGKSYVIPADAEGKTVKVRVKGKDGYAGELTSAPTETILAADQPFVFVEGIELSAQEAEVAVGKKITLTATVTPDNATAPALAWSSDNEAIATVKDGVVTGVAEGTVTITASSTDTVNNVTATCQVTVTKAETPVTPSKPSSSGSTTTETKEDGTKVTTTTKPDGTVTETVEEPDGTKAVTETKPDGTVTAKVEEPDGTKAVTETKPDGSKTATVEQADGTKSETVVTAEGDATVIVTDPEGEEIAKVEIPATIPEPETKFEDLAPTPWAEASINKVAGLELVKGVGGNKYDPVTPMTRGALATVLHRLSNGKTDYEVAFKDVAANRYYTEGVAWAAKANVVKGISEDIFAPDQIITREQLAVMLARYAKLIGMSTKADTKSLDQFADGDNTGSWAVDGVAWCVEKGILKGKGLNNLDPTADVSRAEVAVMLDRFIALIQK